MQPTQVSNLTQSIQNGISALGIPYCVDNETIGDGNCFFRAVLQQLHRGDNFQYQSHRELRMKVVDYVERDIQLQHNDVFQTGKQQYIIERKYGNESNEQAWQRLLIEMRCCGKWADDIFILCTALFLQQNIKVTSCLQNKLHPWTTFYGSSSMNSWKPPLTLGMIPNVHFQSIIPNNDITKDNDKSCSTCLSCGATYKSSVLYHLRHHPNCGDHYDLVSLKNKSSHRVTERKREWSKVEHSKNKNKEIKVCKGESHKDSDGQFSKKINNSKNPFAILDSHELKEDNLCSELVKKKNSLKQKLGKNERPDKLSMADIDNCKSQIKSSLKKSRKKSSGAPNSSTNRIDNFFKSIQTGPIFPCFSCNRLMFKESVVRLTKKEVFDVNEILKKMFNVVETDSTPIDEENWLCRTCHLAIKKEKRPSLCQYNGLKVEKMPCSLRLNELGNTLVAKNILFLSCFSCQRVDGQHYEIK